LENAWEKGRCRVSGWMDDLKGFVAEHAEAVRSLAKVLRVVAAGADAGWNLPGTRAGKG
jgi:hypothetical protein